MPGRRNRQEFGQSLDHAESRAVEEGGAAEDVGARGDPGSVGEYGWGGAYHSTYWVDPVEKLVDAEGREYRVCPQCAYNMYKQGRMWVCENCGYSYVE